MTSRTAPRELPPHLRKRARRERPTAAPAPTWQVGHYDGPLTDTGKLKIARFLATGLVPPVYQRNPGACLSLILKAQALDIPLATAVENLHWNPAIGRGALSAQLMAALLRRHHYTFTVTTETDQVVAMTFHRIVDGRRRRLGTTEWKITEAVAAGLTWREQWRHYPTDMLWARCLMRGARRYASEVGTGLAYTVEELADMAAPTPGSELAGAVQDILTRAADADAATIRHVLVKEAKAKQLLDVEVTDGVNLGYALAMLWGEARAAEVEAVAATQLTEPEPETAPAGTGTLACGCPADQFLTTGRHVPDLHHDPGPVTADA